MNRTRIYKRVRILLMSQILFLSPLALQAQGDTIEDGIIEDVVIADSAIVVEELDEDAAETETETEVEPVITLVGDIDRGKAFFQGGSLFLNGGPSCIACHNVTHEDVIPGGLFAKDLTDVYSRLGEGLVSWLGAPPFPAMASTYNNNPLTEQERVDLTAFLKYADETKDSQVETSGGTYLVVGGGIGLICLLGLVQLLWSKRKKKMVKADIFARQHSAWDAKF
ncbi:MAG: hypothetical protein GQ574_12735 [Crocinitomix sp.]|nr:hypothetical protein [Crocinitomix sp.]